MEDKIPSKSDKLTSMILIEIHNKLIDIEDKLNKEKEDKLNKEKEDKLVVSAKDIKSNKSFPKGIVELKKYYNYYDINNNIITAQVNNPNDEDYPTYNREKVFESLERNADILHVANDGTDNLYIIVSHTGGQSFTRERIIYPGDVKHFYNVYELRLRSPTVGLPYRVSEYDIDTSSRILNIRTLTCNDKIDVCSNATRLLGIIQGIVPTNPIIIPGTTGGLGAGSSVTTNYVATGNFNVTSIEVSASGALKIEIKSGNAGLETTKLTAFTTPSNLTIQLKFYNELQLIVGHRLQIIITNRELQALDIYNTIMGFNT